MTTARKGRKGETLAGRMLREVEARGLVHRWPSARWRNDPIGFFRDVLLVKNFSDDQIEILKAVTIERVRISISSGHKTGKDFLAAGIALWWFCSDEEARVRATAVTSLQVRDIFWRELVAHHRRSQLGPYPIDGRPSTIPQNGLKSGAREVVGFTSDQPEAAAGISGRRVMYIFDEASGIDDGIFEAAKGNLAGGDARVMMLSQPTQNGGHFFESHHQKRELWRCFILSSEKTPNVLQGLEVIPGMASREWLAEQAIDWNAPDGPVWKVRIKGEFAMGGDWKVMTLDLIAAAELRWIGMPDPRERLHLGLDCAGMGADENAAAPRRGTKILEIDGWHGTTSKETARRAVQLLRKHRNARDERALVKVDAGGTIGLEVFSELRAAEYEAEIEVVPVHFGNPSLLTRQYGLVRDQMWFGMASWLKEGGALPSDRKLPTDLTAPSWSYDERQRRHVEKKTSLRKRLGRSTDRGDACLLAVFEPYGYAPESPEDATLERAEIDPYGGGLSPYDGELSPYGGGISPYERGR